MEFLLIYPVTRDYLDKDLIRNVAVAAEKAGFKAFLSWDHYMLPDGPDTLDAWSILGYLAGQTFSIKLGTVVTPIPFRPPPQLAKIVSSVDLLSGGRTILGVGAANLLISKDPSIKAKADTFLLHPFNLHILPYGLA